MARRPAFFVRDAQNQNESFVEVVMVDFPWIPGMVKSQKQKCIESMHDAIQKYRSARVLEVSSKSREQLGINLSAFNLGFVHPNSSTFISVESAFQGSKVFESSGPFPELYYQTAREAKKFFKDKPLGELIRFDFYGQLWRLNPRTLFYDWLYLNSLNKNPSISEHALKYDCFTDIEFNPKKSINCQAYSAALFVALTKRGLLESALKDRDKFMHTMKSQHDWIESTEYMKHHSAADDNLL
jgi:hypothetical protein